MARDPKLITVTKTAADYKCDADEWHFTYPGEEGWCGAIENEKTGGVGRWAEPVKVTGYLAEAWPTDDTDHVKEFTVEEYGSAISALAAAKRWVIATCCAAA